MTNTSTTGSAPAPTGVLARFIGIITSPKATYENIVAYPRWLAMLALSCVIMAAIVGGFMFTQAGQDAWLDAAVAGSWTEVSDQQYAAMQRMAGFAGYLAIANMLIFVPIFYLIVAGILFAIFNAAMGGNSTFKQLYAVVVHTAPIGVLAQLVTMPLNYARGTLSSATNLGVLLPMVDETSFMGRFIGMIDLFIIWQLLVLAIGLGVLYKRRTQSVATTLLIIYGIIAVCWALLRSSFGG